MAITLHARRAAHQRQRRVDPAPQQRAGGDPGDLELAHRWRRRLQRLGYRLRGVARQLPVPLDLLVMQPAPLGHEGHWKRHFPVRRHVAGNGAAVRRFAHVVLALGRMLPREVDHLEAGSKLLVADPPGLDRIGQDACLVQGDEHLCHTDLRREEHRIGCSARGPREPAVAAQPDCAEPMPLQGVPDRGQLRRQLCADRSSGCGLRRGHRRMACEA
jgi:hypothetical protein